VARFLALNIVGWLRVGKKQGLSERNILDILAVGADA
jgi:hypothetical protein